MDGSEILKSEVRSVMAKLDSNRTGQDLVAIEMRSAVDEFDINKITKNDV